MSRYRVLSQIKSGGRLHAAGTTVELDDAVAAGLRPGIVEAAAAPQPAPVAAVVEPAPVDSDAPAKPAAPIAPIAKSAKKKS